MGMYARTFCSNVASPLRFRYDPNAWSDARVREKLLRPLDRNLGAVAVSPEVPTPSGWRCHRFDMDNGDVALFARGDGEAHWIGNTETPAALWETSKVDLASAPFAVVRWAERELTTILHEQSPWLADFPYLSWFFLPVFMSKDGRHSTRSFFRDHAAGFPDTPWKAAAQYFEEFLRTGVLDEYRELMAGKLGTSASVDDTRMSAAMGEFIAAKLLVDAGFELTPESEVSTGHFLDFKVTDGDTTVLVEVTRPVPPRGRAAGSAGQAIRETVSSKTDGQLARHGGGAILFVDCSNFSEQAWRAVLEERPSLPHRPAVVYRARVDARPEGYTAGTVPLDLTPAVTFR